MVLAAEALAKEADSMVLSIDGAPHKGSFYHTWKGEALDSKSVTIGNSGQAPVRLVLTTSGNPSSPSPRQAKAIRSSAPIIRWRARRSIPPRSSRTIGLW